MNQQVESMERCHSFDGCSAPVCGLDPKGEGCQLAGEKVCSLIMDYLEGKDFPLREAIKENEAMWRKHLTEKFLTARLEHRAKFREYWLKRGKIDPKGQSNEKDNK